MRKILSVCVALTLISSGTATAGLKKNIGWLSIVVGGGAIITAFDYDSYCSTGATTITTSVNGYRDTTCVSSGYGQVTIKGPDGSATFARPYMLWTGLGMIAGGTILLLIPSKAKAYTPNLHFMPKGVAVTKTASW